MGSVRREGRFRIRGVRLATRRLIPAAVRAVLNRQTRRARQAPKRSSFPGPAGFTVANLVPGKKAVKALPKVLGTIAIAFTVVGCSTMRARPEKPRAGEEHLIVDCLLPPRMVTDLNLGVIEIPSTPSTTTAVAF